MTMTRRELLYATLATSALAATQSAASRLNLPDAPATRQRLSLDFDWRFHLGHAADPAKDFKFDSLGLFGKTGVERKGPFKIPVIFTGDFDDSAWSAVTLPHDWAVALPFVDSTDESVIAHGFKPLGRTYPETSIGWYRNTFTLPPGSNDRSVSIEFEGIARDSIIVLNGFLLGHHDSGYTPARYDVTSAIDFDGPNLLVVRADATSGRGWFYEGAGIHRHAWLTLTHPLQVAQDGVFVYTEALTPSAAVLQMRCEVEYTGLPLNAPAQQTFRLRTEVFSPQGARVGVQESDIATVGAGERHELRTSMTVAKPQPWSPETPVQYQVRHSVLLDGAVVDTSTTRFGIRTVHFDPDRGFLLNGSPVKLQGFSMHPDHAGVGMAVPDAVQRYRLERLRWMGANAYRTAHNPHAPALMDACDELGILVMDETRNFSLAPEALADLETLIRRDRNRPSVVIWSLGNEEMAVQANEHGERITQQAQRIVARLDPSRQCTVAMNESFGKGITNVVEVQGVNYARDETLESLHHDFPHLPIVGTETASMTATRGEYTTDAERFVVSAYDVNKRPWSQTAEEWIAGYGNRPWVAGGFAWTGFDYRGEPSPYPHFPSINSHFGLLDTCGFAKDMAWFYRAWWTNEPVLHVMPHWSFSTSGPQSRLGKPVDVWVLSNMDTVELFLNGHSLGRQAVEKQRHNQWTVPFAPGVLEARGTRAGKTFTEKVETVGPAAEIRLEAWRTSLKATSQDATVVNASVHDAQGRLVPDADALIRFRIDGPARIIGVGNGNPTSLEPDSAAQRKAFHGLCQAVVLAQDKPGSATVIAEADGLKAASVRLNLTQAPALVRRVSRPAMNKKG